jgi:hypothetical protein
MPNFDKTGPQGAGPGTGRGMGPCKSGNKAGVPGRGMGRGRGFMRNMTDSLEEQEKFLEAKLEEIRKAKGTK